MGCKKLTYNETLSPLKVVCSNLNISGISCVGSYRYGFNGMEKDDNIKGEGNSYTTEFRQYDPRVGRWLSIDPLAAEMPSWSSYNYTFNNPLFYTDPDGRQPIKPFAGTVKDFLNQVNNLSTRKVGRYKGSSSHDYMINLSATKFNWSTMRPEPTQTGFYNQKKGRYIYTEKGGWIDMTHFLFYASKTYKYKLKKQTAQDMVERAKQGEKPKGFTVRTISDAQMDPIGEAVQDGYFQEQSDVFSAGHSAYSYEDLPSDYFGADFAVNHYDPDSDVTFGNQIANYLNNILGATTPESAPNYQDIPEDDSSKATLRDPNLINKTTTPKTPKPKK